MTTSCAIKTSTRGWKSGTRKPKNAKRVAFVLEQKNEIIKYYDESKKNVGKAHLLIIACELDEREVWLQSTELGVVELDLQ